MSIPKGMKCVPRTLVTGDKILIYSDSAHIILQLRHLVPTDEQLLEPSFKVAVPLTPAVIWRKLPRENSPICFTYSSRSSKNEILFLTSFLR